MTSRVRLLSLLAGLVLVVAGCGGGGGGTSIEPPSQVERQPSLLASEGDPAEISAGEAESYEPEGEIVADSGFRPWEDGFSFENYGNDAGPQNMIPANVETLFGTQVCESGTGDTCELTPIAQQWMDTQNEGMAGGHCMGFSVTANQFFNGVRDPAVYGADVPYDLPVRGNVALQSIIAENFTYQVLPSVVGARVKGTPSEILDVLIESLNDEGGERYTLGFYKRDYTGGHAVTPFAVEDRGDGLYAILIYDNNFPGITRAVEVDTNEDTWSYVGGTNPDDLGQVYEGDAETQTLELDPNGPADAGIQPCHFCAGEGVDPNDPKSGTVPAAGERYDEITLTGSPSNHAHLILEDGEGRQAGFIDGRLVNEIPGVEIVQSRSGQTWNVAPEPTYLVPQDLEITATIDGSGLEKPDTETITLIGTGAYIEISDIVVKPGEKNVIEFQGGETGFIFHTAPSQEITPVFAAAIQEEDTFYVASGAAIGVAGGSVLTMYFDTESGQFAIDTEGTKGRGIEGTGYAVYVLSFIRSTPQGDSQWSTEELLIKRGDFALLDYRNAPARNKPLTVYTADRNSNPTGEDVLRPDND